jgi:hypothetical protein
MVRHFASLRFGQALRGGLDVIEHPLGLGWRLDLPDRRAERLTGFLLVVLHYPHSTLSWPALTAPYRQARCCV